MLSCLIFKSRVDRGIPRLAAAPFGPATFPLLSARADHASVGIASTTRRTSCACEPARNHSLQTLSRNYGPSLLRSTSRRAYASRDDVHILFRSFSLSWWFGAIWKYA